MLCAAIIWGSNSKAPQASLKSYWPGNLNRTTPQQGIMESFEESFAAKRRRLTCQDMQQDMQTEGPSSGKKELADCVKVKKESAKREMKYESLQNTRMEAEDLWLLVKKEIKEEMEQDLRSSSFSRKTPGPIMVKEELEEGAQRTRGFDGFASSQCFGRMLEPSECDMEDAGRSEDCKDSWWKDGIETHMDGTHRIIRNIFGFIW